MEISKYRYNGTRYIDYLSYYKAVTGRIDRELQQSLINELDHYIKTDL